MDKVKRCATCEHSIQGDRACITCKEYCNWVERSTIIMSKQKYIIAKLKAKVKELERIVVEAKASVKIAQEQSEPLQAQLAMHRWIPVSERLPDEPGNYQVIIADVSEPKNRMYYGKGEWEKRDIITHWKPILLPKEG